MMKELKKNRVRHSPTKSLSPGVQGVVKNLLEIVEVKKYSLSAHRCSLQFSLTLECLRLT